MFRHNLQCRFACRCQRSPGSRMSLVTHRRSTRRRDVAELAYQRICIEMHLPSCMKAGLNIILSPTYVQKGPRDQPTRMSSKQCKTYIKSYPLLQNRVSSYHIYSQQLRHLSLSSSFKMSAPEKKIKTKQNPQDTPECRSAGVQGSARASEGQRHRYQAQDASVL